MNNDFLYVQKFYGVPACLGRVVLVGGERGIITEDRGHHIGVNFDSDKPGLVRNCHPVHQVEYFGIGEIRKMSSGQRRYLEYLDVSECYDDFRHFLLFNCGKKSGL